jgi:hypothetical protein
MPALESHGYRIESLTDELPRAIHELVARRDWAALDAAIAHETRPGGVIFERLRPHARFASIEHIISIRATTPEYADEDGIWHDDGSRVLAFSLSLTLAPEAIEGGRLQIRRRGLTPQGAQTPEDAADAEIQTPPFGTMIVFATGQSGYEHRIRAVTRGERVIIAGWCT